MLICRKIIDYIKDNKIYLRFIVLLISLFGILIGLLLTKLGFREDFTGKILIGFVLTVLSICLLIGCCTRKKTCYFPFVAISFMINVLSVPISISALVYGFIRCTFSLKQCPYEYYQHINAGLIFGLISLVFFIINYSILADFEFIASSKRNILPTQNVNKDVV